MMKPFTLLPTLAAVCMAFLSCKKEAAFIEHDFFYASPLRTVFELRDTGQADFQTYEYILGSYRDTDDPVYIWRDFSNWTSRGPSLCLEIFNGSPYSSRGAIFTFKFWDAPPQEGEVLWNKAQLEALFLEGRSFRFGLGQGKVDLMVEFPEPSAWANYYDERSKASYLAEPEGELRITKVEEYEYQAPYRATVKGKLVHCTFEGLLGKYDDDARWLLESEPFTTDAAISLKNGEATFFVAYR